MAHNMNIPNKGAEMSENWPVIRTSRSDGNTPRSNTLKESQQMACAFTFGEVRTIHNRERKTATERCYQVAIWEPS